MREKMICPVCKGSGIELFKHIDYKTGEYIEERIECELCCGNGVVVYECQEELHSFSSAPTEYNEEAVSL